MSDVARTVPMYSPWMPIGPETTEGGRSARGTGRWPPAGQRRLHLRLGVGLGRLQLVLHVGLGRLELGAQVVEGSPRLRLHLVAHVDQLLAQAAELRPVR